MGVPNRDAHNLFFLFGVERNQDNQFHLRLAERIVCGDPQLSTTIRARLGVERRRAVLVTDAVRNELPVGASPH